MDAELTMAKLIGNLKGPAGPVVPVRDLLDVKHDDDLNDGDLLHWNAGAKEWTFEPQTPTDWSELPREAQNRLSLTDVRDVDRDIAPKDGDLLRFDKASAEWKLVQAAQLFPLIRHSGNPIKSYASGFGAYASATSFRYWQQQGNRVQVFIRFIRSGADLAARGTGEVDLDVLTLDPAIPPPNRNAAAAFVGGSHTAYSRMYLAPSGKVLLAAGSPVWPKDAGVIIEFDYPTEVGATLVDAP